jgi:hypothetical protein
MGEIEPSAFDESLHENYTKFNEIVVVQLYG